MMNTKIWSGEMKERIKPYIIVSTKGEVLNLLETNEKGYKKSIEQNQIWAVNPGTKRLLPEAFNGKIVRFREKPDWYQATLETTNNNLVEGKQSDNNETGLRDDDVINSLFKVIEKRRLEMPEGSYTTHLFESGLSKIKKKTGEEAVELLLAEDRQEIIYEASDLIYHLLVLISANGIKPEDIFLELRNRE